MNEHPPIVLSIENLSDIEQEASIFSFIENNEFVKIKSEISTAPYEFIKNMLYKQSYVLKKIYVSIADHKFINTVFKNTHISTYGNAFSMPYPLLDYFDPYQQQEGIICIDRPFILEAGTDYKINLLPKQKIQLSLQVALKFYGALTSEIQSLTKSLMPYSELRPIQHATKKYQIKEIHNLETRGYSEVFQPTWSYVTLIRTIGFTPESVFVDDKEIKSENETVPLFKIVDANALTAVKIKIPEGSKGYVLFYTENE